MIATQHAGFQNGFTLIELLVVTALSIIIIIGAASLFFTSIINNAHKDVITTVKQEGDYALSQMEFLLRNATRLESNPSTPTAPDCTPGMKTITFRSQDNGITTLAVVNNKIASSSGAQTVYLTSDAVTLSDQDPLFECQQVSNVGGYIQIHFALTKQNTDFSVPNTVTNTFTTSVNLRSF